MTVQELIAALSNYPMNWPVSIVTYADGRGEDCLEETAFIIADDISRENVHLESVDGALVLANSIE